MIGDAASSAKPTSRPQINDRRRFWPLADIVTTVPCREARRATGSSARPRPSTPKTRTRAVHDLRITENTYETVEVIHAATLKRTPNYAALAN